MRFYCFFNQESEWSLSLGGNCASLGRHWRGIYVGQLCGQTIAASKKSTHDRSNRHLQFCGGFTVT